MAFSGCCFNARAYTAKSVSGVLGHLKCKTTVKSNVNLIRHHHVSFGTPEKLCVRQSTYVLKVLDCGRCSHRRAFGVAFVRAASTNAISEVRFLHRDGFVASCQAKGDISSNQLTANASAASTEASSILKSDVTESSGASSVNDVITSIGSIPEPPALPPEAVDILQGAGEPSFVSLGLGGWSPVGMIQTALEYLHISYDIPWWGAIVIGTVVARSLMFPLVILSQRNAAKMANNLPQLQLLQLKMTEARQMGNQIEAARYAQELVLFMKEKQLNPFKNIIVPVAQAPLFISFFMALRGMANVPVDSMRTGGLYWFTDLTVPDQYYLMPIITSVTLWITIEVGADSGRLTQSNMQMMRYVLRALPVVILPFTINFPGAILVYWCSTNFISLIQVGFLRIPAVREYFKIEKTMTFNPDSLPVKPKGFVKGLKESYYGSSHKRCGLYHSATEMLTALSCLYLSVIITSYLSLQQLQGSTYLCENVDCTHAHALLTRSMSEHCFAAINNAIGEVLSHQNNYRFSVYLNIFAAWTNMKISKELEDRQRLDELQFNRAGKGPIQKTYKFDPTKIQPSSSTKESIAAKRRDT